MEIFIVLWFVSISALLLIVSTGKLDSDGDFETVRLYFAGVVLCVLGFIFVLAIGILAFSEKDELGRLVFDACKTIIPPIVTLVLGYYFGQDNSQQYRDSVKTNIKSQSDAQKAQSLPKKLLQPHIKTIK